MTGAGEGADKEARQDMFPTRVAAWQVQPRIGGAPVGTGRRSISATCRAQDRRTLSLAARHPALRDGAQITRFAGRGGAAGVFAVSRIDAAPAGRIRRGVQQRRTTRGRACADIVSTHAVRDVCGPVPGAGVSSGHVRAASTVTAARAAAAVVSRDPAPTPPRRRLHGDAGPADLRCCSRARSACARTSPASIRRAVTFAFRSRGTKGWVATRHGRCAPFRLFLEPGRFTRGERSRSSQSRAAPRVRVDVALGATVRPARDGEPPSRPAVALPPVGILRPPWLTACAASSASSPSLLAAATRIWPRSRVAVVRADPCATMRAEARTAHGGAGGDPLHHRGGTALEPRVRLRPRDRRRCARADPDDLRRRQGAVAPYPTSRPARLSRCR